jgi:large subunit ribosomal protein L3
MRRNADETATEDAPAGMIEADAAIETPAGPTDAEIAAAAEAPAETPAEEKSDAADDAGKEG